MSSMLWMTPRTSMSSWPALPTANRNGSMSMSAIFCMALEMLNSRARKAADGISSSPMRAIASAMVCMCPKIVLALVAEANSPSGMVIVGKFSVM